MGSTPTFGTTRALVAAQYDVGAWLSLVERSVRVAEVGGSNPLAPTTSRASPLISIDRRACFFYGFLTLGQMNVRIGLFTCRPTS